MISQIKKVLTIPFFFPFSQAFHLKNTRSDGALPSSPPKSGWYSDLGVKQFLQISYIFSSIANTIFLAWDERHWLHNIQTNAIDFTIFELKMFLQLCLFTISHRILSVNKLTALVAFFSVTRWALLKLSNWDDSLSF